MKYKLLLGGVRIDGVTDVKESVKRDVKQYISVSGKPFCEDIGATLKFWQADIELGLYDKRKADKLLAQIKQMGESGLPVLVSVESDMGSFSARVLVREIETGYINSEACRLTLGLLQYERPVLSVLSENRPGDIPAPPSLATADSVYKITAQYSRVGSNIRVKNPLTGADIGNIAAVDGDTPVKIEMIG